MISNPGETERSKTFYIFTILATLALGLVKCSIVFYYRCILCVGIGIRDLFDLITRIMLTVLALWSVAFCSAFGFRVYAVSILASIGMS